MNKKDLKLQIEELREANDRLNDELARLRMDQAKTLISRLQLKNKDIIIIKCPEKFKNYETNYLIDYIEKEIKGVYPEMSFGLMPIPYGSEIIILNEDKIE